MCKFKRLVLGFWRWCSNVVARVRVSRGGGVHFLLKRVRSPSYIFRVNSTRYGSIRRLTLGSRTAACCAPFSSRCALVFPWWFETSWSCCLWWCPPTLDDTDDFFFGWGMLFVRENFCLICDGHFVAVRGFGSSPVVSFKTDMCLDRCDYSGSSSFRCFFGRINPQRCLTTRANAREGK